MSVGWYKRSVSGTEERGLPGTACGLIPAYGFGGEYVGRNKRGVSGEEKAGRNGLWPYPGLR